MVFASLLVLCMLKKECVVKENYFCVRITALHALWYWLQTTGVQSWLPPSPRLPAAFASPSQTRVPAAPGGSGWNKGQGTSRRGSSLSRVSRTCGRSHVLTMPHCRPSLDPSPLALTRSAPCPAPLSCSLPPSLLAVAQVLQAHFPQTFAHPLPEAPSAPVSLILRPLPTVHSPHPSPAASPSTHAQSPWPGFMVCFPQSLATFCPIKKHLFSPPLHSREGRGEFISHHCPVEAGAVPGT